jgi:hypothetical protein
MWDGLGGKTCLLGDQCFVRVLKDGAEVLHVSGSDVSCWVIELTPYTTKTSYKRYKTGSYYDQSRKRQLQLDVSGLLLGRLALGGHVQVSPR